MDVCSVVRQRLDELGLDQKDLAVAADVTESYVSQLLTRKKLPPAPSRTDLYGRMERLLKLPKGKLSELALAQRREELKRQWQDRPAPLLRDLRDLVLRKCPPARASEVRSIFERESLGELEQLNTQKLLDLAKKIARAELESESWLRLTARLSGRSQEQMRVLVLEFLDTDIFNISTEDCVSFLDPLIESWDMDIGNTFAMEVVLNRRLVPDAVKRFEFVEKEGEREMEQPGFQEFLRDPSMSGGATKEEIDFLKMLRFKRRRPSSLYYYRELQNLRDPLHFS
jgi:transcriptional regulator with XRE-family HTH domain